MRVKYSIAVRTKAREPGRYCNGFLPVASRRSVF